MSQSSWLQPNAVLGFHLRPPSLAQMAPSLKGLQHHQVVVSRMDKGWQLEAAKQKCYSDECNQTWRAFHTVDCNICDGPTMASIL
jgi:hypothetical protein